MKSIKVICDGGYRSTLDKGAWAYVIVDADNDNILTRDSGVIRNATNNIAEYLSVISAIKACKDIDFGSVEIVSDSQLVISQIAKGWKINNVRLKELHSEVMKLGKEVFGDAFVKFAWSSRENPWNKIVDKMCDDAIERGE